MVYRSHRIAKTSENKHRQPQTNYKKQTPNTTQQRATGQVCSKLVPILKEHLETITAIFSCQRTGNRILNLFLKFCASWDDAREKDVARDGHLGSSSFALLLRYHKPGKKINLKNSSIIKSHLHLGILAVFLTNNATAREHQIYDASFPEGDDKPLWTPPPSQSPSINGAKVFGVRPGKPVAYKVAASGNRPLRYKARGLPKNISLDPDSGWLKGTAPETPGTFPCEIIVTNSLGSTSNAFTLEVGDEICLTPPMGWNSWYAQSESVSADSIRQMADAMEKHKLGDFGWIYINIDDCWTGERHPETKALQGNWKFPDMKGLVDYTNAKGFKLGVYSTVWMSTYAGYLGGSAPNEQVDYSEFYLAKEERLNPAQYFGRYPSGIRKSLCLIGPVWMVDRDAQQFADWGIDYVKYDWKEWTLKKNKNGDYYRRNDLPQEKTEEITKRFHDDFRAVDRDIVLSLSPAHNTKEDKLAAKYSNLWRLTNDIKAEWKYLIAPFSKELSPRFLHTRQGHYGDLDMLQIGNLGTPNQTNEKFYPTPLSPAEQYFQVSLWCMLHQPLLLSCDLTSLDSFTLNLITNSEVLSIGQDSLGKPASRFANSPESYEVWSKPLADGSIAIGLFNLRKEDQLISISLDELGTKDWVIRDLWRQKDIEVTGEKFSAKVEAHGVLLIRLQQANSSAGA